MEFAEDIDLFGDNADRGPNGFSTSKAPY